MQTGIGTHADNEALERYSMGMLPEPDLARLEEHLLVCPECQGRLEETDEFIRTIRTVAPRLRAQPQAVQLPRWRRLFAAPAFPRLALAGALALLVLAFVVGRTWNLRQGGDLAPATIVLQLARGPEPGGTSVAPTGRRLTLEVDLTQLPVFPSYGVEVVKSTGGRLFFGQASATAGKLRIPLSQTFRAGFYYVRLHSPAGELLREFGLQVR